MKWTSIIVFLLFTGLQELSADNTAPAPPKLKCGSFDTTFEMMHHPRFATNYRYYREFYYTYQDTTATLNYEPTCIFSMELKHKTMNGNSCDAMYKLTNIKGGTFYPLKKKHFHGNPCVISDYYMVCVCWFDYCNLPHFWWDTYRTVWLNSVGEVAMQLHKHLWTIFKDIHYEHFQPRRFLHPPYQGVPLIEADNNYPSAKGAENRNENSEVSNPMKCIHKLIALYNFDAFDTKFKYRGYATAIMDHSVMPPEFYDKPDEFTNTYQYNTDIVPVYKKYKIPKVIPYEVRPQGAKTPTSQPDEFYETTTDKDDYSYLLVYNPDGTTSQFKKIIGDAEVINSDYDGDGDYHDKGEDIYTAAIHSDVQNRDLDTIVGTLGIAVFVIFFTITIFVTMYAWKTVSNFDSYHRRMTDTRMAEVFDKALKNPVEKKPKAKSKGKKFGKGKKENVSIASPLYNPTDQELFSSTKK